MMNDLTYSDKSCSSIKKNIFDKFYESKLRESFSLISGVSDACFPAVKSVHILNL